ncbi:IscS subfamily cysteine desulfurase [Piscibacillus halophilus]|uniref:Cysteine desulfurase n=1 Tax=Piscibacillus halophilus TaxID=571933 RepID=A0A1H9A4S3_9BACI|nr:IscS subfamily cysteine desulfurase [Piscibacillus halophilus]SEP71700.1 cysteine desulfurase [Piscibacillus halophilus]
MKYFDYAATTPMSDVALETYTTVSRRYFANTNSLHDLGSNAGQLLEQCKFHLAKLMNCKSDQLFFTKGGSEANILGVQTLLKNHLVGKHVIVSMAEHNSIIQTCEYLKQLGYDISYLEFNSTGQVDLLELESYIREDTALVIVQHVNGEIGTIQPIEEIANLCRQHHIFLHMDSVQSFGRMDLSQVTPLVDSISVSSHKIYGPKGMGLLYLKDAQNNGVEALLLRGNTMDLASIASFVTAAYEMIEQMDSEMKRMNELRKIFFHHLVEISDLLTVYENLNGNQIPSIIGMGIHGIEGQWVMLECNRNGFAISTGSACDVKYNKITNTLKALSIPPEKAREFFRISIGKDTSEEDMIELAQFLVKMTLDFKTESGIEIRR